MGAFRPELQRVGREDDICQPIPQFGKRFHASLHQQVAESHHQIADAPVAVRRVRCVLPAVKHGRWDQRYVTCRKGLKRVARRSISLSVNHVIQFPRVVPVQLRLDSCFDPLVYEEERVIFRFGQFIRDGGVFHTYRDSDSLECEYTTNL